MKTSNQARNNWRGNHITGLEYHPNRTAVKDNGSTPWNFGKGKAADKQAGKQHFFNIKTIG